jgi:hypothetical protein
MSQTKSLQPVGKLSLGDPHQRDKSIVDSFNSLFSGECKHCHRNLPFL